MPEVRKAMQSDLSSLLALFHLSEVSRSAEPRERTEEIWSEVLGQDNIAVFVSMMADKVFATCTLITAPNLLRGGRRHGFMENVVTHPDHRGKGHGRAVVGAALTEAWLRNCYHVLLQSGRPDPRVRRFYEQCGFKPELRIGYCALPPGSPPDGALNS